MHYIHTLVSLDDLDPYERFNSLTANLPPALRRTAELVLLELFIVDNALESVLSAKSVYILDNGVLRSWLVKASGKAIDEEAYIASLVFLDEADLIFRFTCAKKFAINDKKIKQLRINSWGKALVNDLLLVRQYDAIAAHLKDMYTVNFTSNLETYNEIIRSLRQPITPAISRTIARINQQLPLQLLA